MKKIVPFNNVLTFDTDVCEITAISLEHDIKKNADSVSGVFYISGEYKITDGQLDRETFKFDLPFDIALGANYDLNTLTIDIDDFRYELVGHNELKVNIDLSLDGDVIEVEETNDMRDSVLDDTDQYEPEKIEITESLDLVDSIASNDKENTVNMENTLDKVNNSEDSVNIFEAFNEDDDYVTYRVYCVSDGDTIDGITKKYNITKEELAKYNVIDGIKPGDKLIIPANDK